MQSKTFTDEFFTQENLMLHKDEAAARDKALKRWVEIAKVLCPKQGKKKDIEGFIAEVMEPKATTTLMTRASSWALYLAWARQAKEPPTPLTEDAVAEYLRVAPGARPREDRSFKKHLILLGTTWRYQWTTSLPQGRGDWPSGGLRGNGTS